MMKKKARYLSNQITLILSIFSVIVVVVCCALLAGIFYVALDNRAVDELMHEGQALAAFVDANDSRDDIVQVLHTASDIMPTDTRVTVIGSDGTVLFDNMAEESGMPNHLTRPEVEKALLNGEGHLQRYSETLQEETMYYSVLLPNEMVLRLSATQDSVIGIIAAMVVPATILLLCVIVCSSIAGRIVARRISASVERIDLDYPFKVDTYEELVPLLCRIDNQRKRLDEQASERRAFTANVSHELKTPLTIISGYAEIMANGLAKPEDTKQFAHLIHSEARRMKGMVDDLIELSHLDDMSGESRAIELVPGIDMSQIVLEELRLATPLADEYHVKLIGAQGLDNPHFITGNARILGELVGNLVQNAIRYNSENGMVAVSLEEKSDTLVLQVADSGVGIPEELRERVFERFYRVDVSRSKETGGSGLGLAIVKHAAQIHKATASLKNNEPQGTIATVSFPL